MSNTNESPVKRTQQVEDETARILAKAVSHFTQEVLQSPVNALIIRITKATEEWSQQQKTTSKELQCAADNVKKILGNLDQGVLDFLRETNDQLDKISQPQDRVHKELELLNKRIKKCERWQILFGFVALGAIVAGIIAWLVLFKI